MILSETTLLLCLMSLVAGGLSALRGHAFHTLMVGRVASELQRYGFKTDLEVTHRLPGGGYVVIDIEARYFGQVLLVEVETTPRNAIRNLQKGAHLPFPLWLVLPTRRLGTAVKRRWSRSTVPMRPHVSIILFSQVEEAVATICDLFSRGETPRKTPLHLGKQIPPINTPTYTLPCTPIVGYEQHEDVHDSLWQRDGRVSREIVRHPAHTSGKGSP